VFWRLSEVKFLVDECVARPLVNVLREHFDDVTHVVDVAPGSRDLDILDWAKRESRTLVTEDYDFGELAFRLKLEAEAIVIIGPGVLGPNLEEDAERVVNRIIELKGSLRGHLTIMEAKRTRQRRLHAKT
jgi:predicted nuclease of predicted toxin-antitoxin system